MKPQDNPELTAYALGELDGLEAAAMEKLAASSPEAYAYVEQVRATAGQLRNELSLEAQTPSSGRVAAASAVRASARPVQPAPKTTAPSQWVIITSLASMAAMLVLAGSISLSKKPAEDYTASVRQSEKINITPVESHGPRE